MQETKGVPIRVEVTCCPEHIAQSAALRPVCTCFRVPCAFYCATQTADLAPGYGDTPAGMADARDQAAWDAHTAAAITAILEA